MKMNVGSIDRLIRLLLASALFYLGLFLYSGTGLGVGFIVAGSIAVFIAFWEFIPTRPMSNFKGIHSSPLQEIIHGH